MFSYWRVGLDTFDDKFFCEFLLNSVIHELVLNFLIASLKGIDAKAMT